MQRPTPEQRVRSVGIVQMEAAHAFIARTDKPRTGRPRVTTPHEDRYLRAIHLWNCFRIMMSPSTNNLVRRVSRQVAARRLREKDRTVNTY